MSARQRRWGRAEGCLPTWLLFDDTCEDLGIEGAVGRVWVLPLLSLVNGDAAVRGKGNTKVVHILVFNYFLLPPNTTLLLWIFLWLTLAPEDAAVADAASVSAACLHSHSWLVPWDTVISWARASCTCLDACWDSARVVGGVGSESCDTCSLVSWFWSYEDLGATRGMLCKVCMIIHTAFPL